MVATQINQGEMGFFDFYIIREWYFIGSIAIINSFSFPPLTHHSISLLSLFFITQTALAKKLKDCGVFGVSSDEYLNYAMQNRQEWEVKGLQIVEEYQESLSK